MTPVPLPLAAARLIVRPGLLFGVGLGAWADEIVLHQIAHWHQMGSARVPPHTVEALQRNMAWDGWFSALTLVIVVSGVYLFLVDARRGRRLPTPRMLTGHLLLGWSAFNLVEGIVAHHLLELHHVRDLPTHLPSLDWLFLIIGGLALFALGWVLSQDETLPPPRARPLGGTSALPDSPSE